MKTIRIKPERTIVLPKSIFRPNDRAVTFCEGDTFIVKKLTSPEVTEIAGRVKGKLMPLKEIVKEVHLYRKQRKTAG